MTHFTLKNTHCVCLCAIFSFSFYLHSKWNICMEWVYVWNTLCLHTWKTCHLFRIISKGWQICIIRKMMFLQRCNESKRCEGKYHVESLPLREDKRYVSCSEWTTHCYFGLERTNLFLIYLHSQATAINKEKLKTIWSMRSDYNLSVDCTKEKESKFSPNRIKSNRSTWTKCLVLTPVSRILVACIVICVFVCLCNNCIAWIKTGCLNFANYDLFKRVWVNHYVLYLCIHFVHLFVSIACARNSFTST